MSRRRWRKKPDCQAVSLCLKKRPYEMEDALALSRRYTAANRRAGLGPCRPYLCPYCKMYHITKGEYPTRKDPQ